MEESKSGLGMSVAIVIAALIIGGAIVYTNKGEVKKPITDNSENQQQEEEGIVGKIAPITAADHIRGDINAKIKIVEYSDTECPYCKMEHIVLKQAVKEFAPDVAWVYRHMPIVSLHDKALPEAIATECVAELGGEEKFWTYLDRIYETTPGNDGLDLALLPKFATDLGIDKAAFEACQKSGKHEAKINAQMQDGFNAGARGTPYAVIVPSEGEPIEFSGWRSNQLEVLRNILNTLLKK